MKSSVVACFLVYSLQCHSFQEVYAAGSFTDDAGVTHSWEADAPQILTGAMDAVSLFHLGMAASQVAGTIGERTASGSNYGGIYADVGIVC